MTIAGGDESRCGLSVCSADQGKGEYDEDFERHQNQETAVVKRLNGEGAVKAQNYGYGNYEGTSVYVRKVAPLGDPIEVTVRI